MTHASRLTDAKGTEYHTYHIEVEVEADAAGEVITRRLLVCRRFSDFTSLDGTLRATLPAALLAHLPTLPSSLIFNKLSDSVVNTRRAGLDKYVRALLASSAQLTMLPEVVRFFDVAKVFESVALDDDTTGGPGGGLDEAPFSEDSAGRDGLRPVTLRTSEADAAA